MEAAQVEIGAAESAAADRQRRDADIELGRLRPVRAFPLDRPAIRPTKHAVALVEPHGRATVLDILVRFVLEAGIVALIRELDRRHDFVDTRQIQVPLDRLHHFRVVEVRARVLAAAVHQPATKLSDEEQQVLLRAAQRHIAKLFLIAVAFGQRLSCGQKIIRLPLEAWRLDAAGVEYGAIEVQRAQRDGIGQPEEPAIVLVGCEQYRREIVLREAGVGVEQRLEIE
jgi:hypothetical protein